MELTFLGRHVSSKGIRPLKDKVHVVQPFPRLTRQRELCEYSGRINFFHREAILKPLNNLLAAPVGKKKELIWTDAALKAFTEAKKALANATLLSHPITNAPTRVRDI